MGETPMTMMSDIKSAKYHDRERDFPRVGDMAFPAALS
jgi:hypothetical protein